MAVFSITPRSELSSCSLTSLHLLCSLLSERIILFSESLVQINGVLHMGPRKPPRSSSSLCHCHGDSSGAAGLVGDKQRFLVVTQAHMDTFTDSSSRR
ncbi:hypothetical protein VZT92_022449 [Zoarces viviparus]|uniref:Uncharacterized protein n=1 Tax=Zoarces viviparus TaxID=48416 RepID=A0AAW1EBC7_ZOAVI